ncbi:MAG: hypothetical protein LBK60_09930 [Verrucomicrobiales bacterium]|jgi:hypothetical protein|nr:hypothetical protein [Verrucomicrobiales bacterium]
MITGMSWRLAILCWWSLTASLPASAADDAAVFVKEPLPRHTHLHKSVTMSDGSTWAIGGAIPSRLMLRKDGQWQSLPVTAGQENISQWVDLQIGGENFLGAVLDKG